MKNLNFLNKYRIKHPAGPGDEHNGAFILKHPNKDSNVRLAVIASNGAGWDHVSVSISNRIPNWNEMCYIKNLFFDRDEVVVQYHPAEKDYVNFHPNCLHLWRCQDVAFPTPPTIMV